MSLLDAILGRVTEVKSAKDGADLKIHVSRGNMPDDVITWKDKYVIVRDQEKADRLKTPIEEEAEKPDAEHFEGINPPPSDEIEQGEIVFVAPEDSAALDAPWARPITFTQISDPDAELKEGYAVMCKDCIEKTDVEEVFFVAPGVGVCNECGAENRRLYIIGELASTLDEEDVPF